MSDVKYHDDEIRPRVSEAKFRIMQELYDMEIQEKGEIGQKRFTTVGRHLILGCMHIPFHDKSMFESILSLKASVPLVGLHIIGDFMDLNTFSSHDKGKFPAQEGLTYAKEMKEGNKVLDLLLSTGEFIDKSYVWGNHEDRFKRFYSDMENAKRPLMSPTDELRLRERGFAVHEDWSRDYVMLGKHLQLHHGQFIGIHTAKMHMDRLRHSNMFAHTHRIQHYIEGKMGSYNIGFGGDISSPAFNYMPRATKSTWQNGAAVVTLDEDGNYFVEQLTFINNHFVYGGKIY
jgi:hypothetical protein